MLSEAPGGEKRWLGGVLGPLGALPGVWNTPPGPTQNWDFCVLEPILGPILAPSAGSREDFPFAGPKSVRGQPKWKEHITAFQKNPF